MTRWRLTKILVVAAAGLALAAGTVATVAATRDGDDQQRAAAQEESDDSELPWLGVLVRPSDEPAGLAVRHVSSESPAADAGLERAT